MITSNILLAGLLLPAALTAPQESAVAEEVAPVLSNLERALGTISADEIRADLSFIASDEMAGRDSPSPQLKIAARFIRTRLMRLGFEPGAQEKSYFHEWQIFKPLLDRDKSGMTIDLGGGEVISGLELGRDYFFEGYRSLGMRDASGQVIYGGELSKSDVDDLEVDGKWVLATKGVKARRLRTLEKNGALGILVLPAKDAEKTVAERYENRDRSFDRSRLNFKEPEGEQQAGFPTIQVTEGLAKQLPLADIKEPKLGQSMGWTVSETCAYDRFNKVTLENVAGIWPGSDPELQHEVIILSAHYDHVGVGADGKIYNGADDNGSGTCGMLAIAEALAEYGPMRRSVMLMWVSAEEKGLLGSEAWTRDPYLPGDLKALCNINIDMIGRNAGDEFLITPTKNHKAYSALTKVAEANAEVEGFTKIKSADAYWERSDQYNFEKHMGLPVAFLFCDVHEDYHKPTDTPDKINYDKMRRICRLVVRMLEALQIDRPKF